MGTTQFHCSDIDVEKSFIIIEKIIQSYHRLTGDCTLCSFEVIPIQTYKIYVKQNVN